MITMDDVARESHAVVYTFLYVSVSDGNINYGSSPQSKNPNGFYGPSVYR